MVLFYDCGCFELFFVDVVIVGVLVFVSFDEFVVFIDMILWGVFCGDFVVVLDCVVVFCWV